MLPQPVWPDSKNVLTHSILRTARKPYFTWYSLQGLKIITTTVLTNHHQNGFSIVPTVIITFTDPAAADHTGERPLQLAAAATFATAWMLVPRPRWRGKQLDGFETSRIYRQDGTTASLDWFFKSATGQACDPVHWNLTREHPNPWCSMEKFP